MKKDKLRKILLILFVSINAVFAQDVNCFDVARKGNFISYISSSSVEKFY